MTLEEQYRAILQGAAIGGIAPRRQIAVAGKDRASFLQGLLTNDIQALVAGSGCYSAWLTPQGRMLTDMHVLESGDLLLLDVPEAQAEATLQRLDQFLFSEDVQFESMAGSLTGVWVHGPGSAAVLEKVLGSSASLGAGKAATTDEAPFADWPEYHHARIDFANEPVVVARISQLGVPGFCVYLAPSREAALAAAMQDAGAPVVAAEAIEVARVEAGYPVFGTDMTEDTIPLEAGIEGRAISLTKGCYVGQEIIIRVLHRGGGRVAKRLVGLRVSGAVPERGARLFAGGKDVGVVTSAADSPRRGAVALAYVHRDFTAPDSQVEVETSGGRTAATVTSRPMP